MKIPRTILFTFCITASLPSFGQNRHDYKTYSTILEEFLRQEGAEKRLVIIQGESDTTFFGGDPTSPELMANLESLMRREVIFSNEFQIKKRQAIVISREEFQALTIDENGDLILGPTLQTISEVGGRYFPVSDLLY